MGNKSKYVLMGLILINSANAKNFYSGDITGRKLLIPGLGWAGHVAIGTGDYVGQPSGLVIEALNEAPKPVIQINGHAGFKQLSTYWGSRYGIGDYADRTKAALIEANHQRWWCPTYSNSTAYVIGQGDLKTGKIWKCGMWRCDTFVAWDFYSAGYTQLMDMPIIIPLNVYNKFPYQNTDTYKVSPIPKDFYIIDRDKKFDSLSAKEINDLSFEEFERLADIPIKDENNNHVKTEWKLALDPEVNAIKRGIFLDRLAVIDEDETLSKFLSLYEIESQDEVKSKLLQGMMIQYQSHRDEIDGLPIKDELKKFYASLLKEDNGVDSDKILRGFIDFHDADELLKSTKTIEKISKNIEPHMLLGLQNDLTHQSIELEAIYLPKMIKLVKKSNNSDLDDMFFGLMKMSWNNLKNEQSKELIKDYLNSVRPKYESNNSMYNYDNYFVSAKDSLTELGSLVPYN